jgi:phosphatidylglycerol:prolipoprotein diacylglycerol transferase
MNVQMPQPELIAFGPFALRWYGIFAALAALTFYLLMVWRAKRFSLTIPQISDLLLVCVISGIIGARLEFVRRTWSQYFAQDFLGIFRVWEGGLVFQGGFILAVLAVLWFCRRRKWSIAAIADLTAPALPAAHAVARLGCLLNGCCFGIPWSGFAGVQYPPAVNDVMNIQRQFGFIDASATAPLPCFPVQLLESVWCLIAAVIIYLLERKKILEGRRFLLYVIFYSVGRFTFEFLRGDYPRPGILTPAQWTTLLLVMPATLAVIVFLTIRRKKLGSQSSANG